MIIEAPFYWVDKYPDRGGSSAVPVAQVLDKIFPDPGNADPAPPLFRELQDKLASAQKRAKAIVLKDPDIKRVQWELDRDWLSAHGITLPLSQ